MKPLIGLIPLVDDERESLWMLPGYMEGIAAAGALPLMLPLTRDREQIDRIGEAFDGFLLTGGHDVSPSLYGARRLPACGATCEERDRMERAILELALKRDAPLLGICRGIQFVNAAMGGTLWQDLPSQRPSPVEHHQRPPYDAPVHGVRILAGTPLRRLLGAESLRVNSYHHQAVRELAPGLAPMALAEDGLVEALWRPESDFLWAVQWHPEFCWQADSAARAIFGRFVDAARSYAARRE